MLIKLYILNDIIIWNNTYLKLLKADKIINCTIGSDIELINKIKEVCVNLNYNTSVLIIKDTYYFLENFKKYIENIRINKNFNILNLDETSKNIHKQQNLENLNCFVFNIKNSKIPILNYKIYSWTKLLFAKENISNYYKNHDNLKNLFFTKKIVNFRNKNKFFTDNVYILYSTDEEYLRFKNYCDSTNFKIDCQMFKSEIQEKYCNIKNDNFLKDIKSFQNFFKHNKNSKLNSNQKSHIYSFINILNDAIEKKYESICILEYDILFHKDIDKILPLYYNLIKNSNIIYLGSSQYFWINPINNKSINFYDKYYEANHSMGTFGIILKSNIFNIYINILKQYLLPSDVCLSIISKYCKSYVCYPNLVICDISTSNLKNDRDIYLTFDKFKWDIKKYKISLLNQYYDRIYVLNLKKDVTRKNNIIEQFNKYNIIFQFYNAINGQNQQIQEQSQLTNSNAYAYILNMITIFTEAKEKNYKNIIICDDDCLFIKDFNKKINILNTINFNDYYMIKFGSTQHVWNNIDLNFAKKNKYYFIPEHTDGSFAVGYNFKIFDELIKYCQEFKTTFDSGPLREIYKLYPQKCICFFPNLIIADISKSNISNDRNIIEYSAKLKWYLDNYIYSIYLNLRITVIISIYNKQNTILDSLKSIVNQTYKNIEIICIDDCSKDKSYDIVNNYILNNNLEKKVKLLKTDKNSGCYVCRNIGITNSTGDFIAFQDADDLSLSYRIEKQMVNLLKSNLSISFCSIYRLNNHNLYYAKDDDILNLVNKEYNQKKWKFKKKLGIVTSIIKKTLFNEYGLYNEHKRHSSDLEIIERIFCLKYKINPYDINHIHTRISNNELNNFCNYFDELLYICDKMNENNISNIYKNQEKKQYEIEWKNQIFEKINDDVVIL